MGLYETIIKVIEDEITKCSPYKGMKQTALSTKIKGVLNKFNKEVRGLDYEKCIIFDNNGNILAETDGDSTSCQIPYDQLTEEQRDKNFPKNIVHNHPHNDNMPVCFSEQDFHTMDILNFNYNTFNVDEEGKPHWDFIGGVESVEATNGSRMSIAIKDPKKLNEACLRSVEKHGDMKADLNKITDNIPKNYFKALKKGNASIERKVKNYMKKNPQSSTESTEKYLDRVYEYELKTQKEYYTENLPKLMEKDIKKLDDMGIELSVGWVD